MNASDSLKYDRDLFNHSSIHVENKKNVSIRKIHFIDLDSHIGSTIYLKSTLFLLVQNGNAEIEINFKKHQVTEGQMILLSFGHFFKIIHVSTDIHATSLYVEQDFIHAMYSTDMLYKRVKYGVKMFEKPILSLPQQDFELMLQRVEMIHKENSNSEHIHHREIVLNFLHIYFLDLSNIIEQTFKDKQDDKPSREEIYFEQFLTLLVLHYKTEHSVDFYAQNIHISPHYLTKIVKKLTGQTVSDFIFKLVYSDAQELLKQPQLSIQQIAMTLNFSDQSAFGKFFKRKSGYSPKEFRRIKT